MKRMLMSWLLVLIGSYALLCLLLFVFQRSLIYFPQPRAINDPQATMRLPVDDAELVITTRIKPGAKAIIYFGGNAEDVSLNLPQFSQWFPDHALYLMHYRGYGGSTGSPSEAAIHSDAAALFNKVRETHSDITVIGRSLGSGVAIKLAREQSATRLVLVTPYDSIEGIAAQQFFFVPVRWLLRDKYRSGDHAPHIQVPTTLIVAERDEVIPRASTDLLMSRFGAGVAQQQVMRGASHNDMGVQSDYLQVLQRAISP